MNSSELVPFGLSEMMDEDDEPKKNQSTALNAQEKNECATVAVGCMWYLTLK